MVGNTADLDTEIRLMERDQALLLQYNQDDVITFGGSVFVAKYARCFQIITVASLLALRTLLSAHGYDTL